MHNNNKKLLSIQPFSLYDNGGGSRILRRLYTNNENEVLSVGLTSHKNNKPSGYIEEILIKAKPLHRKWMRSFVRTTVNWLRSNYFIIFTNKRISNIILQNNQQVIHLIDHGNHAPAVIKDNKKVKPVPLWVSFHDHFSAVGGSLENTGQLWKLADRRIVISEEMGTKYQQLFGDKQFEIITDGVDDGEISEPRQIKTNGVISIYFAGLLHIDYLPLFRTLADALDELTQKGKSFKFVLRGTQKVDFLLNRKFEVEFLPLTLDNAVLKTELDAADILYLPIKFALPEFSLYSLSTKMIGYLGGSGAILYHGPGDSAAYKLLSSNKAAVGCTSFNAPDMIAALNQLLETNLECSINAKKLVKERFRMIELRNKFWQIA